MGRKARKSRGCARGKTGREGEIGRNSLPIDIKNCENVSSFKKRVKQYLLQKATEKMAKRPTTMAKMPAPNGFINNSLK